MTSRKPRRTAAEAREHILDTALDAFVQHGYDGVGLREIAKAADVDPRLVGLYFGSKEGLFTQALERTKDAPLSVSKESALGLLTDTQPLENMAGLLMTLRSTSNPRAVEIAREMVERHFERELTERLEGDLRPERAALLISINLGVLLMKEVLGNAALNGAGAEDLAPCLEAVFGAVTDPPARRPRR